MVVSLKPEIEKLVREKVNAGQFPSADELVNTALEQFMAGDDFAPGELDALLAVGESQAEQGRFVDGEDAFRKIESRSAARRQGA